MRENDAPAAGWGNTHALQCALLSCMCWVRGRKCALLLGNLAVRLAIGQEPVAALTAFRGSGEGAPTIPPPRAPRAWQRWLPIRRVAEVAESEPAEGWRRVHRARPLGPQARGRSPPVVTATREIWMRFQSRL